MICDFVNLSGASAFWRTLTILVLTVAVMVITYSAAVLVVEAEKGYRAWKVHRARRRIAKLDAEMEIERRRLRLKALSEMGQR